MSTIPQNGLCKQIFSFSYKGHAPAYTAIGWYALNFQDNTVKAAKMFGIADRMGHRDASHNLGYMYKTGRYPGKQADQVSVCDSQLGFNLG